MVSKKKNKEAEWEKMDYPTDKNGNLYKNSKLGSRNKGKKERGKNSAIAMSAAGSWEAVGRFTEVGVNSPYDPIPNDLVGLLLEQIKQDVPYKVALKVIWVDIMRGEFFIDRGLYYLEEMETETGEKLQKKTYIRDEIMKSEGRSEANARKSMMDSIKKWDAKMAVAFLQDQAKDACSYFSDTAEWRQIARDMELSVQEYYWCLNVLNGISQKQASKNVGLHEKLNKHHWRMNPAVNDFIRYARQKRREEIIGGMEFTKATAQQAIMYSMGILLQEIEKPNNSKQDYITLSREIRNTAEIMGKATNLFPKDEVWAITNIAVLAGENTEAALAILWAKHGTKALDITQFDDDKQRDNVIEWTAVEWTETQVQVESD